MSKVNQQSVVFIVKDGNDIVGYINLSSKLNESTFAKVEANLLTRLKDRSVVPELVTNKEGETYLTFQFKGSAVAWFRAADEEDTPEAVYGDLMDGSLEYDSYVRTDINASLDDF